MIEHSRNRRHLAMSLRHLAAVLCLALITTRCGGGSSPTSPSAASPGAVNPPTVTVSGLSVMAQRTGAAAASLIWRGWATRPRTKYPSARPQVRPTFWYKGLLLAVFAGVPREPVNSSPASWPRTRTAPHPVRFTRIDRSARCDRGAPVRAGASRRPRDGLASNFVTGWPFRQRI